MDNEKKTAELSDDELEAASGGYGYDEERKLYIVSSMNRCPVCDARLREDFGISGGYQLARCGCGWSGRMISLEEYAKKFGMPGVG